MNHHSLSNDQCGACKHWRRVKEDLTKGECWGGPPQVVIAPNGQIGLALPAVPSVRPACGVFKRRILDATDADGT